MNAAVGDAGVALGLAASVLAVVTLAVGLLGDRPQLRRTARIYVWIVAVGALLAFVAMERALITRDFTLLYVAENGSSRTPALFNFATLWGSLEGSIILWSTLLAGYLISVSVRFRRESEDPLVGWALLTMFVVCAFFFGLMTGPADPFRSFDPPLGYDGPGPNPLLQNHILMAVHPPMLYLGYVGFTVPFAFAVGALVTGRLDEGWLGATRRWTLLAWVFLTTGIVLGAWWSYEVLGWGGYWAWDPVENASLLPWLTATAFIHSMMVQERRGMLRVWNLSLVAATFSLTILGTFITRSGVLESVHAFTESSIGPALLGFFATVVAVTVGLIAWRGDELRAPGRIESPVSREASFFANNLVFAAFAFVVLLGTVFPLVVEAVNGDEVNVGPAFFDRMTAPLGMALLFLMAVAPVLPWRKAHGELLARRLHWPAWFGTISVLVGLAVGARGLAPLLAFGLGGFAAGAAVRQLVLSVRRQGVRGLTGRKNGGMVVHIGVVVVSVALAASAGFQRQAEFDFEVGETVEFAGHTFTYLAWEIESSDDRDEWEVLVEVDGHGPYAPARTRFNNAGQAVGTPSVRSTLVDDVHLSVLVVPDETSDVARLRITVQPLVIWLWIGGGIMLVGGALAALPWTGRRGRRGRVSAVEPSERAAPSEPAAPDMAEPAGVR